MKTLGVLSVALLLLTSTQVSVFAQSSSQLLTEAQRAYIAGQTDIAKEKFQAVLKSDPENTTARNYLKMINSSERTDGGGQLEKQLKAVVLEKVELKDATFGSALEYLKQQVAKQSKGSLKLSFVVQLPPEFADTQKVSLSLEGIPFPEVLRYLCEMGGVEYKIEKYAVIIKKKGAVAVPAPQSPE